MTVSGENVGTEARSGWRPGAPVVAALCVLVPLLALEIWARTWLFEHVSYSNSRSLDASWKALNAARDWSIIYIGDSEVRWGFDPDAVDRELANAGLASRGFNMAIDGFSGALSAALLPHLGLEHRMPKLEIAVIGTQLTETHPPHPIERFGDLNCEGALQKPIFASPMARDLGFAKLCQKPHWTNGLVRRLEGASAVVRYRQALRTYLVGWFETSPLAIAFNSSSLEHRPNGFQPHMPIREARRNHDQAWAARRRDVASNPRLRGPLDPKAWPELIAPGGYFDRWADAFLARGVLPVFVALPTNPILIDLLERRPEYARNSALLRDWEKRRGDVVVIDLDIKDSYIPDWDFGDFRHLSIHGASRFSSELGTRLAGNARVREALRSSQRR